MIAFSDNVQDAAHRAGFFAARTASVGVRAAIAQVVERHDGIALADLPERVEAWWHDTKVNSEAFDDERFVSEFIAPDRLWRRDFVTLQREDRFAGRLAAAGGGRAAAALGHPGRARLPVGYRPHPGTYARAAAVGVGRETVDEACRSAHLRIREKFGALSSLASTAVRSLVLGVLRRMKDPGRHPERHRQGMARGGRRTLVVVATTRAPGLRSTVGPAHLPGRHASYRGRDRASVLEKWRPEVLVPGMGPEGPDPG